MDSQSLPTLSSRLFAFDGDRCLYRDHRGRRVVADCEGPGRFVVERGSVEVLTALTDDSFPEGFTAVCEGDACVRVLIGGGKDLPSTDAATLEVCGEHLGCGWVVEADGPFAVDGRHEPGIPPRCGHATPFWREYRGGSARIVERPWRAVSLDAFSIDDPDALRARAFRVQNISDVLSLASAFEDGTAHTAPVASHLNTASWDVAVPPEAAAILLRKTFDRFHGRQRARVSIGGVSAGYWYEPVECRTKRWGVSDFVAPVPAEGGLVRVSIDPVAGAPLWSVSQLEVWAFVPTT